MLGQLACSGVGRAMSHEDAKDTEQLWDSCARSNEALLGQLREASVADRACLRGALASTYRTRMPPNFCNLLSMTARKAA